MYKLFSNLPEVHKFDSLEDACDFTESDQAGYLVWYMIKDENGIPAVSMSETGLKTIH